MNLSLILNMPGANAAATPGAAAPSTVPLAPEMASFQDFLAVMGLSPMAVEPEPELGAEILPDEATLLAANDTGNTLPPALAALPVLPEIAASLFQLTQTTAQPAQGEPAEAPPSRFAPSLPTTPATVLAQMPLPVDAQGPAPALAPAPANPMQPQAPAVATLEIELVLPPATPKTPVQTAQVQVTPQPVIAQLLNAAPRPTARKTADTTVTPTAPATTIGELAEAPRPASTSPVAPIVAPVSIVAAAPDVPSGQPAAASTSIAAADTLARHDFAAVVDKLSEARELARPGRADMHLMHREFGQVSVQFELAGQALKVAMTSPDAAFAPAVQAALAERPITAVTDAARTDANAPRADTANPASHAGPQADSQRGDGQRQSRAGTGPVQRQNEGDAASRQSAADRDGSRFA